MDGYSLIIISFYHLIVIILVSRGQTGQRVINNTIVWKCHPFLILKQCKGLLPIHERQDILLSCGYNQGPFATFLLITDTTKAIFYKSVPFQVKIGSMESYLLELVKIRNIKPEVANKCVRYDFIPAQTCFCHVEVSVGSFDPRFLN